MTLLMFVVLRGSFALMVLFAVVDPRPAAARASGDAAAEAIKAGLAAQKARRHADAVGYFSRAIASGLLARKQLTYALYRRAVSNRAQKLPAQAISDLNSALYFKGDLSSSERADAIEERAKAFRDAGLKPTPVATASQRSQWSPSLTVAPSAAPEPQSRVISSAPPRVLEPLRTANAPARPPLTEPILGPETQAGRPPAPAAVAGPVSQFRTRVAASSNPVAQPQERTRSYAPEAVDRGVGVTKASRVQETAPRALPKWDVETKIAAPPPRVQVAAAQPLRLEATSPTATQQPSARTSSPEPSKPNASVSGFFSGIFGAGAPAAAPRPRPLVTARVRPAVVSRPVAPSPAAVQTTATAAPVMRPDRAGQFDIQVAVLRSRERADALAQQLMVQYPGSFFTAAKKAHVTETAGPEGAEYAVRFGAYDSKAALAEQCTTFKNSGLECEVVPN